METNLIVSWLRDKAVRSGNHSWERMMMMAAQRLEELDRAASDVVGRDPGYGWIPTTLGIPEQYTEVIGWTKHKEMGEVYYDGKHFLWSYDDGECGYAHVTHWMPLPEPPKGVE